MHIINHNMTLVTQMITELLTDNKTRSGNNR
jgi:hypothetical protein